VWLSNNIYPSLIPKKKVLSSFEVFHLIYCCNLIYKLIAKIITSRLKSIFNGYILVEQFGFLDGCQIHNAVSIMQEVLHSFKTKKILGFMVKLDLAISYDKVNWT